MAAVAPSRNTPRLSSPKVRFFLVSEKGTALFNRPRLTGRRHTFLPPFTPQEWGRGEKHSNEIEHEKKYGFTSFPAVGNRVVSDP